MKKKHEAAGDGEREARNAPEAGGQAPAEAPAEGAGGAQLPVAGPTIDRALFDTVEKERDGYLDLARRARADYVNLQRRMEGQAEAVRDAARQEFAKDMLTSLDELEMAIKHSSEGVDCEGIIAGLELVRQKFLASLAKYGIAPMDAQGAPFDHNLHHAIAEHPTDEAPPGTVYAVAQKGYMMGAKLLRPAHVVVTKETDAGAGVNKELQQQDKEQNAQRQGEPGEA